MTQSRDVVTSRILTVWRLKGELPKLVSLFREHVDGFAHSCPGVADLESRDLHEEAVAEDQREA